MFHKMRLNVHVHLCLFLSVCLILLSYIHLSNRKASVDTTSPVITGCPQDVNLEIPSASITTVSVTWVEPTATDDSGSVTFTTTHQPGDLFPVGSSTPVTYTFSDATGNTAVCSFNVILTSTGMFYHLTILLIYFIIQYANFGVYISSFVCN